MLDQLNQTKKPLPMARINELKALEMANSPYNQPLLAMIKDEAEYHKKKRKEAVTAAAAGKSVTRTDDNAKKYIKQIGGIYGGRSRKDSVRSSSSGNSQSSRNQQPSVEIIELKGNKRNKRKHS